MKIALLVDYYTPFTPGGSEWSVYYLAKQLKLQRVESLIITPNYGAKAEELIDDIKVLRFLIFKKPKDNRSVINPIWQNNFLFFIWSAYYIYQKGREEKIDVFHVNGKFLIPGTWIAARMLHKPVVVTIRDKQLLCSYGRCLFGQNRYKVCDFWEYLTVDMIWFYKNYVKKKNLYTFIYLI